MIEYKAKEGYDSLHFHQWTKFPTDDYRIDCLGEIDFDRYRIRIDGVEFTSRSKDFKKALHKYQVWGRLTF